MYRGMRSACAALFLVILGGALSVSTIAAHAQDAGTMASADPLTLDVQPENPQPYGTITITPSSTVFDIQTMAISITVNGSAFYRGTGGSSVSVPVGGPGTVTKIVIRATPPTGQSTTKTIVIHPASVALVVEAQSSTHPFYQGAGLVSSNAAVRVVAIPDVRTSPTKSVPAASLVYTWKFGDQILEQDSGIGKSVLNATAPPRYRDAPITVTVATQDGSIVAAGSTSVSPVDPVTEIYVNDPLMGPLFDTALTNTTSLTGTEATYRGVGYYYSETPTITWDVNGEPSGSASDITVRSTGSGTGSAILAFQADQSDASLTSNSTVSVLFGQPTSGFLGL
jgi:hypothetical protein